MPTKAGKLTKSDILWYALRDAIDWQKSLLASYNDETDNPITARCRERIISYKTLMNKMYGTHQTQAEVDLENVPLVSIYDLDISKGKFT